MGTRESWVYPSNGGDPYLKGSRPEGVVGSNGPFLTGDLPDFVSPIDGKMYSGRAGLREHNLRHDVVCNADLKGLPTLQSNSDTRSSQQKRADSAARKQTIINYVNKHVS